MKKQKFWRMLQRIVYPPPPNPTLYREENIKYIFVHTIYGMSEREEKYDYCFSRLYYINKGRKSIYSLHERARNATLRLLIASEFIYEKPKEDTKIIKFVRNNPPKQLENGKNRKTYN
jgi:hypothetical protein